MKLKKLLLSLAFVPLAFCAQNEEEIPKKTGLLSERIPESSGLEIAGDGTFYTHNDGDGPINLFKMDKYGALSEFLTIENVKVKDIEDIARDRRGNLYIGDFGNNDCDRKKFKILKTELPEGAFSFPIATEIKFTLPDNHTDHHSKNDRNFDIEAMFHRKGWLYIFTRDRSEDLQGYTKCYKVPDDEGSYTATYIGKIPTSTDGGKGIITAADVNLAGDAIVLLSKEGLYYISNFSDDDFHLGMREFIPFSSKTQKEAVVFTDDCTLYFTDEVQGKKGGAIYEMDVCTELFKMREEKLKK